MWKNIVATWKAGFLSLPSVTLSVDPNFRLPNMIILAGSAVIYGQRSSEFIDEDEAFRSCSCY